MILAVLRNSFNHPDVNIKTGFPNFGLQIKVPFFFQRKLPKNESSVLFVKILLYGIAANSIHTTPIITANPVLDETKQRSLHNFTT